MSKSTLILSAGLLATVTAGYSNTHDQTSDYFDPCCNRLEFWFDPMGVKPCQMVLEFSEERIAHSDIVQSNFANFLEPGFSFGFKLGAQIESNCPSWVFGAQYMWWENQTKGFTSLNGTPFIFNNEPTQLIPGLGDNEDLAITLPAQSDTGSVTTRLEYQYNLLDLYGGWNCCLCQGLQLTPYLGFRAFWLDTSVEEIVKQSTNFLFSPRGDPSSLTNDFNAFGLMGGLGFEWNLCGQLYFFGSFGGSIVSGDNKSFLEISATGNGGTVGAGPVCYTFDQTQCLFIHSVEGKFGFNWSFCICERDYLVGFYYEGVQWNKVLPNPFRIINTEEGSATKTLNGLFLHTIAGRFGISF